MREDDFMPIASVDGAVAPVDDLVPDDEDLVPDDEDLGDPASDEDVDGGPGDPPVHTDTSDAEALRQIFRSAADVRQKQGRYDELKHRTSEAKKALEAAVAAHLEMEEQLERDGAQMRLPFVPAGATTSSVPAEAPSSPAPASGAEWWRETPIEALGLPEGIVKALRQHKGIDTIGQLTDFTAADGRLTDIKGIGGSKAEVIERVLEQFWADRNGTAAEAD